jgi:hypothetical protein
MTGCPSAGLSRKAGITDATHPAGLPSSVPRNARSCWARGCPGTCAERMTIMSRASLRLLAGTAAERMVKVSGSTTPYS